MPVADLIAEIEARRAEYLDRKRETYPKSNPTASDLSPCARETALAILHWQERPAFPIDLVARLERGKDIEEIDVRQMSALGIYIRVERHAFEVRGRDGRLLLRGRLDGFIEWQGAEYPLEIKSVDPLVFKQIHSEHDFLRFTTTKRWARQLQSYLYANALAEGFFLLDDCLGHWKLIPITLDFEAMEAILQQCEIAVAAVERVRFGVPEEEALPRFHSDPMVCRRCWARARVCNPPHLAPGEGLRVIDDPAIELQLVRREELAAAAKEYERIDKQIKETFRNIPQAICGAFLIEGKEQPRHYKASAARTVPTWVTQIARLLPPGQPASESEDETEEVPAQ